MTTHDTDTVDRITTPRLELVVGTMEIVSAELESFERFEQALGAAVPSSWPPAFYDRGATEYTLARLQESPANSHWWMWYVVRKAVDGSARALIGTVGFKGPPTDEGIVEIGYGLVKEFQKQGFASEAVEGLVTWAFAHPAVKAIRAQTLPNLTASIAVMQRNGFEFLCNAVDEGMQTVVYERRRGASSAAQ